jgi:hypothetical protein
MINYVWAVNSMSTLPNVPNLPEYVVLVNGTLTGSNGATPPITSSQFFNVQLVVTEDQADYTPYADLTEQEVITWVQKVLTEQNINNMEVNIANNIASIENPPVVPEPQPLPWGN